jgi:hypothetical protein
VAIQELAGPLWATKQAAHSQPRPAQAILFQTQLRRPSRPSKDHYPYYRTKAAGWIGRLRPTEPNHCFAS